MVSALVVIQYTQYWVLSPEEITIRHRAGLQWVDQRRLGLRLRPLGEAGERMLVWGWQSPVHFYSKMDSVTPYFFTDPLMQVYRSRYHQFVEPRKERILADILRQMPAIVFAGDPPFPELQSFLTKRYVHAGDFRDGRGLYVRPDRVDWFQATWQESTQ